jgi:hypothetical protein
MAQDDEELTARFPDASVDAPSAAAAGVATPPDDAEIAPVPITAWTSPEDNAALAQGLRRSNNPAQWVFERLVRMIEDFESKLTKTEEVGAHLVQAPGEGAIHIQDLGFWGPDLIMFYGKNQYGRPVRLIQHYEQLNLMLTALPIQKDEPRRIGFQMRERMEKAAAEVAPVVAPKP